jgi:hypothetical protein
MTDLPTQQEAVSPFATIWRSPTRTLREILDRKLEALLPLAIASGMGDFFMRGFTRDSEAGGTPSLATIWLVVLLGGALWGIVWVHVMSGGLYLAGRWQGGHAAFPRLRAAVTWSRVPLAATLAWWIPATLLLGRDLFALPNPAFSHGVQAVVLLTGGLLTLTALPWSWFLLVRAVQVAQGFSLGRALGSVAIVAGLLLAVGVAALVLAALVSP